MTQDGIFTPPPRFGLHNVFRGDMIRCRNEDIWGLVIYTSSTGVEAAYHDGNHYDIEWWTIEQKMAAVDWQRHFVGQDLPPDNTAMYRNTTNEPLTRNAPAPTGQEDRRLPPGQQTTPYHPTKPDRDLMEAPGAVFPGRIVKYQGTHADAVALGADRYWVVIGWTRGSRRDRVNIVPLNGEPGLSFDYFTTDRCQVVPVNFNQPMKRQS